MLVTLLVFYKFKNVQSGQYFTSLTELPNYFKNWCVYGPKFLDAQAFPYNFFYICIVHTVVLFQSLAGMYCQTQHVEY
jgi:hypothetical protein